MPTMAHNYGISVVTYRVVIIGLASGQDHARAVDYLARTFKQPPERLEALLAHGSVVVKRGASNELANKMQDAIRASGFESLIEPEDIQPPAAITPSARLRPNAPAHDTPPSYSTDAHAEEAAPTRRRMAQTIKVAGGGVLLIAVLAGVAVWHFHLARPSAPEPSVATTAATTSRAPVAPPPSAPEPSAAATAATTSRAPVAQSPPPASESLGERRARAVSRLEKSANIGTVNGFIHAMQAMIALCPDTSCKLTCNKLGESGLDQVYRAARGKPAPMADMVMGAMAPHVLPVMFGQCKRIVLR